MSNNFDESTQDKLLLLEKIKDLEDELSEMKTKHYEDFYRLVNLFNEKITDLYGEINHLKKHGENAKNVERDKVIMCNYFKERRI